MLNDNQRYAMRGQTVFTEGQVQRRIERALAARAPVKPTQEEMYRETLKFLGISELQSNSTPSSNWSVEGEPDYHPDLINKERGSLMLGDYTDDALANAIFMYGNPSDREKHQRLLKGEIMDIAYLTAGKERIRWLSRHLEAALKANKDLATRVNDLLQLINEFGFELPDRFTLEDGDGTARPESYRNGANYMLDIVKGNLGFSYQHTGDTTEIPVVKNLKDKAAAICREDELK